MNKNKLKYWYHITIFECVICNKRDIYKTRVFKESEKKTEYFDNMCWSHQL